MALRNRSGLWVALLIIGVISLFIGSQLWLQFGATPTTGVSVSVYLDRSPGGTGSFEGFIGEQRMGKFIPILDLPDSIASASTPEQDRITYTPIELPADYQLDSWFAAAFPDTRIVRTQEPVPISSAAEGAGVEGSVTEILLERADGALDPIWWVEFRTLGTPEHWGVIARARSGTAWRVLESKISVRPLLWYRENHLLRREISFGIEIFIVFEEREPDTIYWLDRVDPLDPTLPAGALPAEPVLESADAVTREKGPTENMGSRP